MCLLTFFPPFIQPDASALANGATFNDDGHGYAIVVNPNTPKAYLIVRHSMDSTSLIEQFQADRLAYPEGPALFHSRWGTSGDYGLANVHPFIVNGDMRTVVAHNGVLPSSMLPGKGDRRCDTRMNAEESFATDYGHLASPCAQKALAAAISSYNKLVFLTVDPDLSPNHVILINEASGQWNDGIWYSNGDYCRKPYVSKYPSLISAESWEFTDDDSPEFMAWLACKNDPDLQPLTDPDCEFCGAKDSVDLKAGVCELCMTCVDCEQDVSECDCYIPDPRFISDVLDAESEEDQPSPQFLSEYLSNYGDLSPIGTTPTPKWEPNE